MRRPDQLTATRPQKGIVFVQLPGVASGDETTTQGQESSDKHAVIGTIAITAADPYVPRICWDRRCQDLGMDADRQAVDSLWRAHCDREFPEDPLGEQVSGVDVVLVVMLWPAASPRGWARRLTWTSSACRFHFSHLDQPQVQEPLKSVAGT
jgi:hypothetical protein